MYTAKKRTTLDFTALERDKNGEFVRLNPFQIKVCENEQIAVKIKIYPKGRKESMMLIGFALNGTSNTCIKRIYLDYRFNLNGISFPNQTSIAFKTDKNGEFNEKYVEFVSNVNLKYLKKEFKFTVTLHSISKNKRKRPSISSIKISQIRDDKNENNEDLKREIKELRVKNERYRFALHSLRSLCINRPSKNIQCVEWAKPNKSDHFTLRSMKINEYKKAIQSQPKYQRQREQKMYLIENNPMNKDCKYDESDWSEIRTYFERNKEGNISPKWIKLRDDKFLALDQILNTRRMKECEWQKNEEMEEQETFALIEINKGVILGQYGGSEMLKSEYLKIYNGTKQEAVNDKYLHGENLFIPTSILNKNPKKKRKLNKNEKEKGKVIEVYIVPFNEEKQSKKSPLLFINDSRFDINSEKELNENERARTNCEFVSVLVNGWISILVRTTKKIKKNQSLLIWYGHSYHLIMENMEFIKDAKNKMEKHIRSILSSVDIGDDLGDSKRFILH